MATSRYATTAGVSDQGSVTTQNSTQNQTGQSTTNSSQNTSSNTQNMDDQSLAALQAYIAQLMGGGTQAMANDQAQRQGEINRTRALQAGYSKEAAFADAQGLISQTLRRALEGNAATITRAAEGAGTSQNAMRALLANDASARAAESASVAGLQAATQYGGISANLAGTLEALTRPNDQVSQALAQALSIAKGATQSSSSNTTASSTTNSQQDSIGSSVTTKESLPTTKQSGGMQTFYGAPAPTTTGTGVGSTADTLQQLWGDRSFVDNLTF